MHEHQENSEKEDQWWDLPLSSLISSLLLLYSNSARSSLGHTLSDVNNYSYFAFKIVNLFCFWAQHTVLQAWLFKYTQYTYLMILSRFSVHCLSEFFQPTCPLIFSFSFFIQFKDILTWRGGYVSFFLLLSAAKILNLANPFNNQCSPCLHSPPQCNWRMPHKRQIKDYNFMIIQIYSQTIIANKSLQPYTVRSLPNSSCHLALPTLVGEDGGRWICSYSDREKSLSKHCQITKIRQFSNKFEVLYSRKNNFWIGESNALQSVEHFSWGIFNTALEAATWKRHNRLC